MRMSAKLGLTALLAAALLAPAVSMASARNISVSTQTFRSRWTRLAFANELVTITCLVTLEGSFHSRTIAKVVNSLIAAITRVTIKEETCTNGRPRPKNLPWHGQYAGFTGTLPAINSKMYKVGRSRWELIVPGLCTGDYGAAEDLITFSAALTGGAISSLASVEGSNIFNRVSGTGICPSSIRLIATAAESTVTALESTARITLTLI